MKADGIVLTGDIAEAPTVLLTLATIFVSTRIPVFFVLGNHDFYGGKISKVRSRLTRFEFKHPQIQWMRGRMKRLSDTWSIVGTDGWGDAGYGDPLGSPVLLNDWIHISDFERVKAIENRDARIRLCQEIGRSEAHSLRLALRATETSNVLVLTHVPPFAEAAWHEGKPSNADFLPWFACKATGDVLLQDAAANPQRNYLVLCGHTHSSGEYQPLPNLKVLTGAAAYGDVIVREVDVS